MFRRLTVLLTTSSLLTSCAVGPDFERPPAPEVKGYTAQPLAPATESADVAGGAAQHFVEGDLPAEWWTLFHSDQLNKLIEQALKANPEVEAAQAALRAARENVYAQEGAYFPSVSGNFSPSRQKTSAVLQPVPNSGAQIYNLYTAQVNVSYSPDVFGLNRRTVESLDAQAEAQRFQLEATYLTLTSNVVASAVQEASLRGQIAAAQKIIDVETELLDLFKRQEKLGQISEMDSAAQEAALAQAQQALPPLQKQLAVQRDQLTALLGRLPSEEPSEIFELSSLQLPEDLPVSLPAKLVEQRPDIRMAQENLRAASAEIGVAIANRLPNITLDASEGTTALAFNKLFTAGTRFWGLAGGVTQPIFEGGTLLHKERAAQANFDQAAAQYRSTVITAFQNVADTLHALQSDAQALKAAVRAERTAARSLELTRTQLRLGAVNYLAVLNAQQTYLQAEISLVQAQANRYADTAALFQALGGGWWNKPDGANEVTANTSSQPSKQGDNQ